MCDRTRSEEASVAPHPETVPGTDRDPSDAEHGATDTPELSVVIVSRNEEERIQECIESVFRACVDTLSFEVVLVDSNSTDRSVEHATDYPISVLQIPSDEFASPAAGRFVGTKRGRGDLLLFVDGDMVLAEGWLDRATTLVRERADVAGVTGYLNETGDGDDVHEVDALRGVALYDREALEVTRGFDPHLLSTEDVELALRLRDAGYRLLRLPTVVAAHPTSFALTEPVRRWEHGYFHGAGQALRKSLGSSSRFLRFVYMIRHPLLTGAWLLAGLLALVAWPVGPVGWLATSAVATAALVARLGPVRTATHLASFVLTLFGLVAGSRHPRPAPCSFPLEDVTVCKATTAVHG